MQLWLPDGLVARLKTAFGGDDRQADEAARRLAVAAIRRNPLGFLWIGIHTYLDYWRGVPGLRWLLPVENGMQPRHLVTAPDLSMISSAFGVDVSNQDQWYTLSRRYHLFARDWFLFLLAAPFLAGLAWRMTPANPRGVALLLFWNLLLLAATCFGGGGSTFRYLHPFSFTAIAAGALLGEKLARRLA